MTQHTIHSDGATDDTAAIKALQKGETVQWPSGAPYKLQQTALDEFVVSIWEGRWAFDCLGDIIRTMLYQYEYQQDFPGQRRAILQDPRYIAYCREQEEAESSAKTVIINGVECPNPGILATWTVPAKEQDRKGDCEKCDGAGWLWAHELDEHEGNPSFDGTRYSCDRCRPHI